MQFYQNAIIIVLTSSYGATKLKVALNKYILEKFIKRQIFNQILYFHYKLELQFCYKKSQNRIKSRFAVLQTCVFFGNFCFVTPVMQ